MQNFTRESIQALTGSELQSVLCELTSFKTLDSSFHSLILLLLDISFHGQLDFASLEDCLYEAHSKYPGRREGPAKRDEFGMGVAQALVQLHDQSKAKADSGKEEMLMFYTKVQLFSSNLKAKGVLSLPEVLSLFSHDLLIHCHIVNPRTFQNSLTLYNFNNHIQTPTANLLRESNEGYAKVLQELGWPNSRTQSVLRALCDTFGLCVVRVIDMVLCCYEVSYAEIYLRILEGMESKDIIERVIGFHMKS